MDNDDNYLRKNNPATGDESKRTFFEIASAIYIPSISVKFEGFKKFFSELSAGNPFSIRVGIKIQGDYYVFNSIQEMEHCQEVKEYLESTIYIPIRNFRFKMEFYEGSVYCGTSAKVKGDSKWQKEKVDSIVKFFVDNYSQEFGKTVSQQISQLYVAIVLFVLFALPFTVAYLWLFFNPNIFSHFLDEMYLSPSLYLIGFALMLISLLLFIIVAPMYLTAKISQELESMYLEGLSDAMRSNKNYYGLSFGAILTALLVLVLFIVGLVTANYPLIGLPQNSSNPVPKFFYDVEKFFSANYSVLVAAVLGIFSLAITLPLFIDWYKRRTDIWGESEELLE